ncbi:MAG: hypothetical protein WC756_22095 [Taibaiella sp.]|jgi:hypothetical protein
MDTVSDPIFKPSTPTKVGVEGLKIIFMAKNHTKIGALIKQNGAVFARPCKEKDAMTIIFYLIIWISNEKKFLLIGLTSCSLFATAQTKIGGVMGAQTQMLICSLAISYILTLQVMQMKYMCSMKHKLIGAKVNSGYAISLVECCTPIP